MTSFLAELQKSSADVDKQSPFLSKLSRHPQIEPTPGIANEHIFDEDTLLGLDDGMGLYGRGNQYSSLSGFRSPEAGKIWGQDDQYLVEERGLPASGKKRLQRAGTGGALAGGLGLLLAAQDAQDAAYGITQRTPGAAFKRGLKRRALPLAAAGALTGALIPKMREQSYSGPDQETAERIYQEIYRRRAEQEAQKQSAAGDLRNLGLVGYDSPTGMHSALLEEREPDARARARRGGIGAGVGGAGGAALGALAALASKKGPGKGALLGALAGGTGGGALGALLNNPVREAYDPDTGRELTEREERRAASLFRKLAPSAAPDNFAFGSGSDLAGARGFGRANRPTNAYAADLDEAMVESPDVLGALLG